MSWQIQLKGDSLSWLLEEDNPGVRYLAMRDLLDLSPDDPDFAAAREKAHREGPIATVLNEMHAQGYWVEAGPGYHPKYRSTVWALIMLAQLGASIHQDPRIEQACEYILDHNFVPSGQFSTRGTPSATIDCLQGNLCAALLDLGCADPRLEKAFEWMTRSITGEGVAPREDTHADIRYYARKCGPGFVCGINNQKPCAWGAVKVMLAFGRLPESQRTPLVKKAIGQGVDFLLGIDPLTADYPTDSGQKPSGNWWKFGFPVFYITDLLQNVEALVRLGYGSDPRLAQALTYIRDKQDVDGRWALDYSYTGKTWVNFGAKGKPNKWVTYRAAWVLKNSMVK